LLDALATIAKVKPRASLVHVIGSPPDESLAGAFNDALRRILRRGASVTWSMPQLLPGLEPPWEDPTKKPEEPDEPPLFPPLKPLEWKEMAAVASSAVRVRALVAEKRREKVLRKAGARILRLRPAAHKPDLESERPALAGKANPGEADLQMNTNTKSPPAKTESD
ncbi:MAG TPA: hypothetical protein VK459_11190, partial [Polyangiaceae bacterium]|nr:hypothetical protein [Polyangiaceae bacterium]